MKLKYMWGVLYSGWFCRWTTNRSWLGPGHWTQNSGHTPRTWNQVGISESCPSFWKRREKFNKKNSLEPKATSARPSNPAWMLASTYLRQTWNQTNCCIVGTCSPLRAMKLVRARPSLDSWRPEHLLEWHWFFNSVWPSQTVCVCVLLVEGWRVQSVGFSLSDLVRKCIKLDGS